jgi:hypothetical protein
LLRSETWFSSHIAKNNYRIATYGRADKQSALQSGMWKYGTKRIGKTVRIVLSVVAMAVGSTRYRGV